MYIVVANRVLCTCGIGINVVSLSVGHPSTHCIQYSRTSYTLLTFTPIMSPTYGSNQCNFTKEGFKCISAVIFAEPAPRSHQWNALGMQCLSGIKATPPSNDNFWNHRNLSGMCVREHRGHFVVAKRKYVLKCCLCICLFYV